MSQPAYPVVQSEVEDEVSHKKWQREATLVVSEVIPTCKALWIAPRVGKQNANEGICAETVFQSGQRSIAIT